MSHHLSIEPYRRCVRTVLSPCQGYMSTVNLFKSFGDPNSDQILSGMDDATIGTSSCACKSSLVTQSLISESSLSISGCFLRNSVKVSVYPWIKLEAGSHLSSSGPNPFHLHRKYHLPRAFFLYSRIFSNSKLLVTIFLTRSRGRPATGRCGDTHR